jgi:hypothetical protein
MDQWIDVVGRAWICQLDDLECCLGSLTLKWPVGVVFIATIQNVAVGEVCWRWAHRTVRCATGQCLMHHRTVSGVPPCHPPVRAWSWSTVGGFVLMRHRTIRCNTGQSGAPLTNCSDSCYDHCVVLFTVRVDCCAQVAVAPLAHRTVWWPTGQSGEL